MKRTFYVILCLLVTGLCFGQKKATVNKFKTSETELRTLIVKISETEKDEDRYTLNAEFSQKLEKTLQEFGSYYFSFDSLQYVTQLISPKGDFKLFTWNLPNSNGTYTYFGFIQMEPGKDNKTQLFKLKDKSDSIANPMAIVCTPNNWYGALYYKVIYEKANGIKYYTLLGWDGNNKISSKKIVDVLYFDEKGNPKFGAPIFEAGTAKPNRVIFEYAKDVTMSLKYEKHFKKPNKDKSWMIVFDHLAPKSETLKGQFQFYGPDMSYDGFVFKKGQWQYVKDVDARNETETTNFTRKPQMGLQK